MELPWPEEEFIKVKAYCNKEIINKIIKFDGMNKTIRSNPYISLFSRNLWSTTKYAKRSGVVPLLEN